MCIKTKKVVSTILTTVLIISIVIATRESRTVLFFDSRIMRCLFYKDNQNDILFSISLSYIAAYIFYLCQTVLQKHYEEERALYYLRKPLTRYIHDLDLILFCLKSMIRPKTDESSGGDTYAVVATKCLYYIVDNKEVKRFTLSKSLEALIYEIKNTNDVIHSNPFLTQVNDTILENYLSIDPWPVINNLKKINIYTDANKMMIIKNLDLSLMEELLDSLARRINVCERKNYNICKDETSIKEYEMTIQNNKDVYLEELLFSVDIAY